MYPGEELLIRFMIKGEFRTEEKRYRPETNSQSDRAGILNLGLLSLKQCFMKKILFSLGIVLALSSCEEAITTEPAANGDHYVGAMDQTVADGIFNSVYAQYYEHFMSTDYGTLSPMAYDVYTLEGGEEVYAFNSSDAAYTYNGVTLPKARMFAHQSASGNILTVVHTYDDLVFSGDELIGGSMSVKLVNGLEIFKVNALPGGLTEMVEGVDLPSVPTGDYLNGWWSCTTKCYATAKKACGDDPQCDFLCDLADLVGQCTISMGVACGIHCATNNGRWNPPYDPTTLPASDPYGFDM